MNANITGISMIIFLIIALTLAVQGVWNSRNEAKYENIESIIQGKWTVLYEDHFNKKIYTYDWCKNGWGLINYLLYKEGKNGVLVGKDNWLFTKEEFDYSADQEERLNKKVDYITTVSEYLAQKDIRLVIAPIPSKARIEKSRLGRYSFPSYKEPIYYKFSNALKGRNIAVIHVLASMSTYKGKTPLFLKTDTHWTPEGARQAALSIANYIHKNLPIMDNDRKVYVSQLDKVENHTGDLLSYVPVGNMSLAGFRPDKINIIKTTEQITEKGHDGESANDLFSNDAPPITLVGTSYSANPLWNFDGYLKEFLQADVLNAAEQGLGPFETMKKYLSNQAFLQTPPKTIIWEIPERYLTFDYDLKTDLSQTGV